MAKSKLHLPHPDFLRRWAPGLAALVYAVMFILAFPPFNQPWAILVFLVPLVKWTFALPRWRTFLWTVLGAAWLGWVGLLIWLRHIYPPWGLVGLVMLSAVLALFPLSWFAAVRWAAPKLMNAAVRNRLLGLAGLAGWWVVLDWVRGWLFTGFPWLPLAAAFWKFPILLQPIEWTGAWGITFVIVLFNLGLVCGTGPDAETPPTSERKLWWPARFGAEIMVPVLLLLGAVLIKVIETARKPIQPDTMLRVGFVQPWTPATLKWDPAEEQKNWETVQKLTGIFALHPGNRNNVDLVLWPEAALAVLLEGPQATQNRAMLEQLAKNLGRPIVLGGIGEMHPPPGETVSPGIFDGVFLVRPGAGFSGDVYAKRHLVPFGEYNPLRQWLPFLGKVVPLDQDTVPGDRAVTLPLILDSGRKIQVGPLVCYEDVFGGLARDEVKAGADLLVVVTNDAWYGTGGGALQHAAHSVLRAIETRRPVVRCGNDGWSGIIDQDGDAFEFEKVGSAMKIDWVFTTQGTSYFRGSGAANVYTYPQYSGYETFYVRFGDWFVLLSALLAAGGVVALKNKKTNPRPPHEAMDGNPP